MSRAWPSLSEGELLIAGTRIYVNEGSLREPVSNAKQSWSSRRGLVLEIWDHNGAHGIGEASPLSGHSLESLSACIAALTDIEQRISGYDADGWPLCPWLDSVAAARFAWESALCDLLARLRGVSVATLLGGQERAAIPRNAVVSSLAEARDAIERGIRTLKVKVGRPEKEADEELHMLQILRHELGQDFALRLDANGVFTTGEARHRLAQYAALHPQFVEQPTSVQSLATLGICAVPWAADESLAEGSQVGRLLQAQGCVAWVLKPAMLGLRRSRELALLAQSHGLGVVLTHLLDGPIGLAAACELALSLPIAPLACGLDRHLGLTGWPDVANPHHLRSDAEITPSGGVGLGFGRAGVPWN